MDFSKEDWVKALMTDGVKEVVETDPTDEESEGLEEDLPIVPDDFQKPTEAPSEAVAETEEPVAAMDREVEAAFDKKTGSKTMSLFEWMEAAIFALIAIVVVFAFGVRTVGVDGASMNYTLLDGDKLLLSSWWYEPTHGDIVVVRRTNEKPLIKRVIACEGDRLDIDELTGKVILNGKVLSEPYLYCSTPREGFTGEVIVPEGYVFVMGDNRINSMDSRHPSIGFIAVEDIMGKALWRIAPLGSFGPIYDSE